jgi:erythromycin esterase-like protein
MISQRLITEKGFSFISVEGDWPDCYRLNRYIKNYPESGNTAVEVLQKFNRWPTWMWANWEIVAFAEWLKNHNTNLPDKTKVGFYGLDVYSLNESIESIIQYLKKNDPDTLGLAIKAANCFDPYNSDEGQSYARASAIVPELCEKEVVDLLRGIRGKMKHYNSDYENVFSVWQNAQIAVNAEKYYRAMIRGGSHSWNIRDRHMVSTLNRLMDFHGENAKVIVWEHNTHIGDARATDMAREGMVNVGQLVNEEHSKHGVISVGFGSYKGTVVAGREWGDVMRRINVPPAVNGSWEHLLHSTGKGQNKLLLFNNTRDEEQLDMPFGHRAIGVVYRPEFEQYGNYVSSVLRKRYDAFIYIDETKALHPLNIKPDGHQVPETFPFGI